jgi:hypothetical protein
MFKSQYQPPSFAAHLASGARRRNRQIGVNKTNELNPIRPKTPLALSHRGFSSQDDRAVFPNELNPPTPFLPRIFPNLTPSASTDKFHRRPPRRQHP